jgi:hypothetical protein
LRRGYSSLRLWWRAGGCGASGGKGRRWAGGRWAAGRVARQDGLGVEAEESTVETDVGLGGDGDGLLLDASLLDGFEHGGADPEVVGDHRQAQAVLLPCPSKRRADAVIHLRGYQSAVR